MATTTQSPSRSSQDLDLGANWLRPRSINITPGDKISRLAIGLVSIISSAVLLTSAGGVLAAVLKVLLIGMVLDFALADTLSQSALYAKCGCVPASFGRSQLKLPWTLESQAPR